MSAEMTIFCLNLFIKKNPSAMLKLLGLAVYAFTIYDVVTSRFANQNDKLIWIIVVVLLPFLGTLLWFLVGREKRL